MNQADRKDWAKVPGIEVGLITGELAKVQLPEGTGRAWVIQKLTFGALLPSILFGGKRVDIQTEAIVWVARR